MPVATLNNNHWTAESNPWVFMEVTRAVGKKKWREASWRRKEEIRNTTMPPSKKFI